jgi:hypothetical protein
MSRYLCLVCNNSVLQALEAGELDEQQEEAAGGAAQ